MLEHMYKWDGNIRILETMSYVTWNGLALPIMLHNAPSEPVEGELADVVNIMGSARPFHDVKFWQIQQFKRNSCSTNMLWSPFQV